MKVMWIVNGMLPEFCRELGLRAANTGGWLVGLCEAVRKHCPKVDLVIVCEGPRDCWAEVSGVRYYAFKKANSPLPGVRRRWNALGVKFKACIRKEDPDLIHFHGTEHAYQSFDDDTWCGKPWVITLQGVINGIAPHYMGGLTPGQLRPHRNWLRYIATRRDLFSVADSWRIYLSCHEAAALQKARCIVGRTDWDKAWAKALAPHVKYCHVGEILRKEFYEPSNRRNAVRHRIFASAAFKYPLKGGHVLLQALKYLKEDFPDVKLVVADGLAKLFPETILQRLVQNEYNRYLKCAVSEYGLWNNVELLPSIDAMRVKEELSRAEVYCQASYVENSPNSLAEAQLQGVPIVASFAGGIPSMVENGQTGLLVPSGDAAQLAAAIRQLFSSDDLKDSLAMRAKEAAAGRHDPVSVVSDLIACYRKVAENAKFTLQGI